MKHSAALLCALLLLVGGSLPVGAFQDGQASAKRNTLLPRMVSTPSMPQLNASIARVLLAATAESERFESVLLKIRIRIDPLGKVTSTEVVNGSGNSTIDALVVSFAREMVFDQSPSPERTAVVPIDISQAFGAYLEFIKPNLCYQPPKDELSHAYGLSLQASKSAFRTSVVVFLQYDSFGTVVNVSIRESTGDKDLDAAALAWSRKVKICARNQPGGGALMIDFLERV